MRFPPVNNEDPLGPELLLSSEIRRSLQRSSQANERWSCRQAAVTASINSHGGWWGELTSRNLRAVPPWFRHKSETSCDLKSARHTSGGDPRIKVHCCSNFHVWIYLQLTQMDQIAKAPLAQLLFRGKPLSRANLRRQLCSPGIKFTVYPYNIQLILRLCVIYRNHIQR